MSSLCSKKLFFFFTSAISHNFIFIHVRPSTDTLQKPSKSFVEKKDDFTKDFFTFLLSSFRPRDTHKLSENRHPALFFFPAASKNSPQSSSIFPSSQRVFLIHHQVSCTHSSERGLPGILRPPFLHHERAPYLSSPAARSPGSQPISRSSETLVTEKNVHEIIFLLPS